MKRLLKAALLAPCLLAVQSVACLAADQAAPKIAFKAPPSSAADGARAYARALFAANQYVSAANQYAVLCNSPLAVSNDYYWLGECRYRLGSYADAARAFEDALQIAPSMESVYPRLADTYLALSQFDKVREICVIGMRLVKDPHIRAQLQSLGDLNSPACTPARRVNKSARALRVE